LAKFCPECGKPIAAAGARFCSSCGAVVDPVAAFGQQGNQPPRDQKSPFLAATCSCFLPGLGQAYNGEIGKGIAVFLGTLFGLFILFIPGLIVWFYGLYDAYSTAGKMNTGQVPFRPAKPAHIILFILLAVVVIVVITLAIMAFVSSLLQSMGGSDFSSILNNGF
jgi:TM2 domain-containing membrane protein YozV